MTPWDRLLHALWRRVGEPGMQCRGPHVHAGDRIRVRLVGRFAERTLVVNSVTCLDGDRVTDIVLREES